MPTMTLVYSSNRLMNLDFDRDYNRAQRSALLNALKCRITGTDNHPLDFAEYYHDLHSAERVTRHNQQVCVDAIRGSVGRAHDYDANFMPLTNDSEQRWYSVYEAHVRGIGLPPVILHKIGDTYFVEDGHHRVSVARVMGQVFIEATVIEHGAGCTAHLN